MKRKKQSKPQTVINQVTSITRHCLLTCLIILVLRKNSSQANDFGTFKNYSGIDTFTLKFVETINLTEMCFLTPQFFNLALNKVSLHRYDSFFFFFSILLISGHIQTNPGSLNFIKNIFSTETINLFQNSSLIHQMTR